MKEELGQSLRSFTTVIIYREGRKRELEQCILQPKSCFCSLGLTVSELTTGVFQCAVALTLVPSTGKAEGVFMLIKETKEKNTKGEFQRSFSNVPGY